MYCLWILTSTEWINKAKKFFVAIGDVFEYQVLLLHDNARPHIADIVKQEITKQKWTVLPHPAYSPDLAPCDFYLFGPLKDSLRGKHFENMDALKNSVRHWIRNTPVDFYTRGMNELLNRWRKCIVTKGDYVEKWWWLWQWLLHS